MTRPILTLLLIALASSWVPAPSEAPENRMGDAAGRTLAGVGGPAQGLRGAPRGQATAGYAPGVAPGPVDAEHSSGAPPSNALAGPKYSASATWCAPTPTQCQGWGGNARLAAVNSFRWGDTPYWVRLTRGDVFADALVVSHCACQGQLGYIDVSPAVFRRLAPLSRGRIDVEVELLNWLYEPGGDPPPHPADEEMRLEDRELPATDAVP